MCNENSEGMEGLYGEKTVQKDEVRGFFKLIYYPRLPKLTLIIELRLRSTR